MLSLKEYEDQFKAIIDGENRHSPYDSEDYVDYVKLNSSRIRRWTIRGEILPELESRIKKISESQIWILITEPWCGDAAQSQPFIVKLAELNPNIELVIQNRDSPESEIEKYLTDGSRSIPRLIIRDAKGKDLFDWGPRPREAQEMVMRHKLQPEVSSEKKQLDLHTWYVRDAGQSLQLELLRLIKDQG